MPTRLYIPKDVIMKQYASFFLLIIFVIPGYNLVAQTNFPAQNNHLNTRNGLAINGYDPVSYFVSGTAEKGKKELSVFSEGATYYFSSASNKELFKRAPGKYQPRYGGWCAYAMGSSGEKVSIDPETFKILDGKLYLFYNRFFNNTLESWNKDEPALKKKADLNWSKIIGN